MRGPSIRRRRTPALLYLASGTQLAQELQAEYEKAREINLKLRDAIVQKTGESPIKSILEKPLEGFGAGLSKVHKLIMDERAEFLFRVLTQRAEALPEDDPRRIAFFGNSADRFACALMGGMPVPNVGLSSGTTTAYAPLSPHRSAKHPAPGGWGG